MNDLCASGLHGYRNGVCKDCGAQEHLVGHRPIDGAASSRPQPRDNYEFEEEAGAEFREMFAASALGGLLAQGPSIERLSKYGAEGLCSEAWLIAEVMIATHPSHARRACVVCGCTHVSPCIDAAGVPCHWVTPVLCSACIDRAKSALGGELARKEGA